MARLPRALLRTYCWRDGIITIPDNLRAGVKRADRYEATLTESYAELAAHYGTCIVPARVRRPREKGKVEAAVLAAQRWILAALRNRTFYYVNELNAATYDLLITLNDRVMRHVNVSRRELYERLDRPALKPLPAPNVSWSMDFVSDGLISGRRLRCLAIVDDCTRECLALAVDTSITGTRVAAVLDRLADLRGLPQSITVDHDPEFEGKVLDAWAYTKGVTLSFIRPGKPVENAYIESFNGKSRDECLNAHWFVTMAHARKIIEDWRIEYNTERPHSSLADRTPEAYAQIQRQQLLATADSSQGPH